jgi:M-phase inducer tyrosine phosphatase
MFNGACYPQLTYPEVYILDGGYSSFFKNHRSRCYPQSYVEMDSREHEAECERGLNKIRISQRGKIGRSQTYAFGQRHFKATQGPIVEENSSPCRGGAGASRDVLGQAEDMELASKLAMTKRSVSY